MQRVEITTGFGPGSGVPPRLTSAIRLVYGALVRRHATLGSITITESTTPIADWTLDAQPTAPGSMSVSPLGWGQLHLGGVYVQLVPFPAPEDIDRGLGYDPRVVEAARRLMPVPG